MIFHAQNPGIATTKALSELVDKALKDKRDGDERRQYLGASMMGKECGRAVAYEYHNTPKDEGRGFSAKLYRIFDMGHDGEERVAQYLQLAGFGLRTHDEEGKQLGYSVAGGKMRGHIDGIVTGGPSLPGIGFIFPALWENKALGNKGFAHVAKHGIQRSKPVYYGQAQIYMAYMGLDVCLFTVINRNTGEIYFEVIPFNQAKAQEISDRGVRVISSASPKEFPRLCRDRTDHRGRFCDYRETCWAPDPGAKVAVATTPHWLKGGAL